MNDRLTPDQMVLAKGIAIDALTFANSQRHGLAAAMIRYHWFGGDPAEVVSSLAAYQNDDGGFGERLEPDIHAPESNPFAARLAMQVMRAVPTENFAVIKPALAEWLIENQVEDGDWHFSDATKAGFLQPWFAGWEFPALNPACCVAGLAASLGLSTESMMHRTADLFAQQASVEQAQTGSFYDLLPYVEYTHGVQLPDQYLDAIASNITNLGDDFDDGGHFFDMAMGGSERITDRIPKELMGRWIDRLLQEPHKDGGWPSPYGDEWRPWITTSNMGTLARLRG